MTGASKLALGILAVTAVMLVGFGFIEWFRSADANVADLTNGGDAYPYVYADVSDLRGGKDMYRLWVGSAGGPSYYVSIWVSPAEANRDANDPNYWSLSRLKTGKQLIYKGSTLLGSEIEPGDYWVELSARNGTVIERLTIAGGKQTIVLTRDGMGLTVPAVR